MKLRKAIAASEGRLVFDAEDLTVAGYLRQWLEVSVKGSVWLTTYRDYAGHIKNHIAPDLGRLKLAKLTATHVQAYTARSSTRASLHVPCNTSTPHYTRRSTKP